MSQFDFFEDYSKLENFVGDQDIFHMSRHLIPEILNAGINRYIELYPYFWQLIESNKNYCQLNNQNCQPNNQVCHNRLFLLKLKKSGLSQSDLYLLTYMTTYFLDLILSTGQDLTTAYYILSKGHDFVINYLLKNRNTKINVDTDMIEDYNGYLLSVLYYLIPNFKYQIKIK